MALKDSLISVWEMDEASGNAIDAHGSYDLTDFNTVGARTGKISGARDFVAASSEHFGHASNSDLQTGDVDFMFSAWVNGDSYAVSSGFPFIGCKGWRSAHDTSEEWALIRDNTSGKFQLGVAYGTLWAQVNSTTTPSAGTWYFVTAWHDSVNNVIGIQVNGDTVATTAHSGGVNAATRSFTIGARENAAFFFDGAIDQCAFWKRVLSADERAELYNSGNGLAYSAWDAGGLSIPIAAYHYNHRVRRSA